MTNTKEQPTRAKPCHNGSLVTTVYGRRRDIVCFTIKELEFRSPEKCIMCKVGVKNMVNVREHINRYHNKCVATTKGATINPPANSFTHNICGFFPKLKAAAPTNSKESQPLRLNTVHTVNNINMTNAYNKHKVTDMAAMLRKVTIKRELLKYFPQTVQE